MRNPYIVGSYVIDRHHYGRQEIIDHLLHSPDDAVWIVGNRRIGKTSLLRQIEFLTSRQHDQYIPIFWDIQGCETSADLARELYYALEDASDRLQELDLDVSTLSGADVVEQLRALRRAAERKERKALLLIDETEALINVGQNDPQGLKLLRKALQAGQGLRVLMTSTKALTRLNDMASDWATSPFLFGFGLRNLWELDPEAARNLIRQTKSDTPVQASDEVVDAICEYTNRHPYLIQVLCQRLWQEDNSLRLPTEADLMVDEMLASFCTIDFRHLAPTERRIVLAVSKHGLLSESDLPAIVEQPEMSIRNFVYSLVKLGYLRRVYGYLAIGNQFLSNWLRDNYHDLVNETQSEV
ncbi:MAG: ATP-binding protein, partial [Anaerolineae bacterium]|nr:ATP-binding protein [Anaerolineae bacterium]